MARRTLLLMLLAAAIIPYFLDLDGSAIWDANEAFYVETPREMMERGDYVAPTFNYEPRLNKPVLSYWIVAGFYKLFGISVGVQRLPIALGAMLLIVTAFGLARAAEDRGPSQGEAGLWAALGLAIAPRLVMFARRILIDIYISAFMALTLLCFALSERYPHRRRLFLTLMYVAVGLGVLTKGPVAAAVPGLVFAVYLLVHREAWRVKEMMLPAGVAIVLAIVAPWYVALYQRDGWTPIVPFFLGENFDRFAEGIGVQDRGPFFYLPVVFSDSLPWSLCLFAAAATWVRDVRTRWFGTEPSDDPRRIRTLLWLWILVMVVFFSFSASKQDLYIFPIVPAIAALGGVFIAGAVRTSGRSTPLCVTAAAIAVTLVFLGGGILYLFASERTVYAVKPATVIGVLAVAGGVTGLLLSVARRSVTAFVVIAAVFITINWMFVLRVLPGFEIYKPVPGFAQVLQERAGPADVIATYDVALPSLVFYLRRHVDMWFDPQQLVRALGSDRTVYAILTEANYAAMAPALPPACVIDRRPTFDVKLKNVLVRAPPPDLVLITNRCK
ncbi:MAG: glycosyltransferase family 39 protein [Acidobacteria bacterium]|nr:glycosyltransferase family 39 protein [Acidobacteriota bacterium]MCA1648831.1 glycosyltransferase family 39 protein [Acidobacteriota bacterium]